jgi:hypothetical protein
MTNLKKLLSILTACLVLMSCTFLVACKDKEDSSGSDKSTSDKKDKDDESDSSKKDDKSDSSSDKDDKSTSEKATTTEKKKPESTTKKPSGNGNAGVDYEIAGSVSSGFDKDSLKPVNAFMNGMQQENYALFLDMFPVAFVEMMKLLGGDTAITNEELMQQMMEEELPEDIDAKFHYVVKNFSEFSSSEISEANGTLAALVGSLSVIGLDAADLELNDGYHLTLDVDAEITYEGKNDSASREVTFEVVKIGGEWCFNLFDDSGNDFMTKFAEAFEDDFNGMFQ